MKKVTLQPINQEVEIHTDTRVLDTLLAKECEVAMACGGQGICATCHVKVKSGEESLTPKTKREQRTLSLITGADERSRLSCQAKVIGEGVVIELPEGMYLESVKDLESLIGRRAEVPILHPRDGHVLIAKGKIITRSRIMQLEGEDLDLESVWEGSKDR